MLRKSILLNTWENMEEFFSAEAFYLFQSYGMGNFFTFLQSMGDR